MKTSINAQAVAKEVIETVRKGKQVNLEKITLNHGYSKSSARASKAKKTQTFKREMEPLIDSIEREIRRLQQTIESKDLSEEKYYEMVKALDILVKNKQLLSGGETERTKIILQISEAIVKKNDINPSTE